MWNENTTEIQYTYIKPLVLESISHSTLLNITKKKNGFFLVLSSLIRIFAH